MKKFSAIMLGISLILPGLLYAHQPSRITLQVNGIQLLVVVAHEVSDPNVHYIDQILVSLNGKPIIRQFFSTQTGNEQKVTYTIPGLKSGDNIEVQANCARGGQLRQTLAVK